MTRINTNVSSLIAQKTLARSNAQLQEALTRLSTGLRINSGKDDPAGLIASEALGSNIVSTQKAISNSQRANQMIATADSALAQVTSLLNDIRGLVTEAANSGAMSADQIAANQLQVDASLDALNRVAQTTSFQGRKLLDGSLDFNTAFTVGGSNVTDLQVNQANLSNGPMTVAVDITAAASQATLYTQVAATAATASTGKVTVNADPDTIRVDATDDGAAYNGYAVSLIYNGDLEDATAFAVVDDTAKTIKIYGDGNVTKATLTAALAAATSDFEVNAADTSADVTFAAGMGQGGGDVFTVGDTADGADGGLAGNLVLELSGSKGSQVLNLAANTSRADVINAINLIKDSTGVEAAAVAGDATGTQIQITSTDYGINAFVNVHVISGSQTFYTTRDPGTGTLSDASTRDTGTDIQATVNGVAAQGDANTISVNTAALAMSATVADGSSTGFTFSIGGGGAMFQLGPDVVSSQQSRIGISSVSAGRLGGASGKLYDLGSGGSAALATNPNLAASILDEVLSKVSSLRGRLGAFQKTTLDTNTAALNDALENLTSAQSSIQDADFAKETANLTRAQILVQSGTSVLAIANQNPQNVLALLKNL
jgi:flagellin